ncbi:MAG: molybdopterin molybdotransferase MoeA [Opitutaceae bacterium]|nr:molybdopterin molybdotransferase MoeA [Verrucomicrobiales bacterium]
MLSLEAAQQLIIDSIEPLPAVSVPLDQAAGRILAEHLVSSVNLPGFDNSAMDGYAVRAADVSSATVETPLALRLIGRAAAGEVFSGELIRGTCVRVFTGSTLPVGADAVIMQEDTQVEAAYATTVLMLDSVKPWENVRFMGEDIKAGTPLLQSGLRLTPGRIQVLAATGHGAAKVGASPQIALLSTGNELVEPGQPLGAGKIYESNRSALAALVRHAGCLPCSLPIVADDPTATEAALRSAFSNHDVVISSGGVSVGELDFVKGAFELLGGRLEFWKVAIKPGRPFVFGRLGQKLFFGLPGNPASAMVTFALLVRPALLRLQGAAEWSLPVLRADLAESLVNNGDRRHFMRVCRDPKGLIKSAGGQGSHQLSSLADAEGLVDVPAKTSLPAGSRVSMLLWAGG